MAETNLQLKVTQAGAAQTAAELGKVADAQRNVGATVDATAKMAEAAKPAVEALAEAQTKLNELRAQRETARESGTVEEVLNLNDAIGEQEQKVNSLSGEMAGLNVRSQDYVGLLNQIDPRLGAVAASLTRASRLAGEFGISLGTVGLLVGGIYAIGKAWDYAAEQIEKATKAIKDNADANKAFLETQREVQQSLETISDKRREGGLTADQARSATATATSIKDRFGRDLDASAVDEAVAMLSGTGASKEDMAQAAFLSQRGSLELDGKARPEARMRALRRAQRKNQGPLKTFEERVAVQEKEAAQEAAKQATGEGGPELDDTVRKGLGVGTTDADVEKIAALIQKFGTSGTLEKGINQGSGFVNNILRPLTALWNAAGGVTQVVTPEEQDDIFTSPIELDERTLAQLRRSFSAVEEGRRKAQTTVNIHNNNNQNWRNIGPSAAAQEEASRNGNAAVKNLER